MGPYPAGRQTFYLATELPRHRATSPPSCLATELAIHAGDAGVPVGDQERAARLRWRTAFALEALAESAGHVRVTAESRDFTVRVNGATATLSAADLVEAASGRLPGDRPPAGLRSALVVLA